MYDVRDAAGVLLTVRATQLTPVPDATRDVGWSPKPDSQTVAKERASEERALNVIRAFVAEERRSPDIFNQVNADAVEHFLRQVEPMSRVPTPDGERAERVLAAEEIYAIRLHAMQQAAAKDKGWFFKRCAEVCDSHEQLRSDLATARADTKRIDWLEETRRGIEAGSMDDPFGEPTRLLWRVDDADASCIMPTAREAIDRARAASPEPIRPAGQTADERESDYRAGYSTGYSDAIAGREMRDENAAGLWLGRVKA
jgi:hypothetical protein